MSFRSRTWKFQNSRHLTIQVVFRDFDWLLTGSDSNLLPHMFLWHESLSPPLGQYSPEKCHPPQEKRAPCYTFKTRTKYSFADPTPSPNSYALPPLIGPKVVSAQSAPAYSLSARSAIGGFSEDLKKVRETESKNEFRMKLGWQKIASCRYTYLICTVLRGFLERVEEFTSRITTLLITLTVRNSKDWSSTFFFKRTFC